MARPAAVLVVVPQQAALPGRAAVAGPVLLARGLLSLLLSGMRFSCAGLQLWGDASAAAAAAAVVTCRAHPGLAVGLWLVSAVAI
jgi:hypothetical protein